MLRANSAQPIKVPQLRNVYQKNLMNTTAGESSLDGFGYGSDGEFPTLLALLNRASAFPELAGNVPAVNDIASFLLCFETGTAPAVGYTRTLTAASLTDAQVAADWGTLQSQAAAGDIDLIAKGTIKGALHELVYVPGSSVYKSDSIALGSLTVAQVVALIKNGDTLTVMGTAPGTGVRLGIDRNMDGTLDGDETPVSEVAAAGGRSLRCDRWFHAAVG